MAQRQSGRLTFQTPIDYPFIPSINNFKSYENITTGLEGLQIIQIAFPSEIT